MRSECCSCEVGVLKSRLRDSYTAVAQWWRGVRSLWFHCGVFAEQMPSWHGP